MISEKTTLDYQKEFRKIAMDMAMVNSFEEWTEFYKRLLFWELELENIDDQNMFQILESQKAEANSQFGKFIEKNYEKWFEANAVQASTIARSLPKIGCSRTCEKKKMYFLS